MQLSITALRLKLSLSNKFRASLKKDEFYFQIAGNEDGRDLG